MSARSRYRAFLSYSHKDRHWADWLHRELERFRVPARLVAQTDADHLVPNHLRPVFRDREELPSAASLPSVVHDALEQSEWLIVICSPDAARSRWVDDEIRTFQRLGRADRILCLIVGGEPHSGDEFECFPRAILEPLDASGGSLTTPAEPVAADARPGQDGRERAKFRLIAGLLGVGLDELIQRDLHRRHRHLIGLATVTSVVALAMAGLAVFAFLARSEAERHRADAEGLVGFMLGDLREKLHEIGRLDLYETVGNKSMEYFQGLGEDDARNEMLAQRAEALRQIGDVRLDQGEMAAALEAFQEALAISRRLAARDRERADWQVALARSHYWVGRVHWQRNELDAAGAEFQSQLAIVDAISTRNPARPEWLAERIYAWTNYGRLLEIRGRLTEALAAYGQVMNISRRLVDLEPDNQEWQLELGFAHNNLGKLGMSLGQLEETERHYRADLDIKQRISELRPNHSLRRDFLAVSHFYLGQALGSRGRLQDARPHLDEALQIVKGLLSNDPTMTSWRHRQATFERELSIQLRMADDQDVAYKLINSSLRTLEQLTLINPDDARWRRDRALSAVEAAYQAVLHDKLAAATRFAEVALRDATQLAESQPQDLETRKLEAMAWLIMGDAAQSASQPDAAVEAWRAALDVTRANFPNTSDPMILDLETGALLRLQWWDEARTLMTRLAEIGYQGRYFVAGPGYPSTMAESLSN